MSEGSQMRREGLSGLDAFLLVVANMVGTGIFITSGFLLRPVRTAPWAGPSVPRCFWP